MSLRCAIPEIKVGDLVKVTLAKDSRVYELVDIAVWNKAQTIKTIEMQELKLPYDPTKKDKQVHKKKLAKAKIKLRHNDRILIKTKTDTKPYQVFISSAYQNDKEIGKVFFTKLMNPAFRCNV